jgi:hypothetical protein
MSLHTLERMAIAGRAASWMSRRDDKLRPGWSPLQPDVHLLEPIVHILEHHGQPSKRRFVAWMKQALHLEAQKVCNNLTHDTQYMGLGNVLRLETDGPVNEAREEGPGRHEMRSALISLLAERRFHARKPLCHRNPIGAAALPMLEFSRIPNAGKVHSRSAQFDRMRSAEHQPWSVLCTNGALQVSKFDASAGNHISILPSFQRSASAQT